MVASAILRSSFWVGTSWTLKNAVGVLGLAISDVIEPVGVSVDRADKSRSGLFRSPPPGASAIRGQAAREGLRCPGDDLARAPHFTEDNRFRRHDQDRVTGKHVLRVVDVTTPAPGCDVGAMLKASMSKDGEDRAMVMQLRALLEKCLELDPAKRIKPAEALADAFVNSQSRNA